jgi:tRNA(fMet)-specific endonuclease VapC
MTFQLRKQGNLLEDFDILLAATARMHDLTLVTGNRDHFGRIEGLALETWLEP